LFLSKSLTTPNSFS